MTEQQKIQLEADEVVFTAKDGRNLTVKDVAEWNQEGVQWTPPEGVTIPEEAQKLHEQGREHGMATRRDEALDSFRKAADLVPNWPHPKHDIAFVHLLSGEWDDAMKMFEEVDKMEPKGFFSTKTAIWALQKEKAGELPQGIYRAYSQLAADPEPKRRLEALQQMITQAPAFAPAWKDLAGFASDPAQAQQIIQNGIAAEPDVDTLGGMLSNLALVYQARGQHEAAIDIVGYLAIDDKSSRNTRALASQALLRLYATAKAAAPAGDSAAGDAPDNTGVTPE